MFCRNLLEHRHMSIRVMLLELVAWHKINRKKGVYRESTEYLIINCKSSQSSV